MASIGEQDKKAYKASVFVYIAANSALLGAVGIGMAIGWTSPALESMGRVDSQPRLIDSEDDDNIKSWIGSSMPLAALFGALISGPISQFFGRKLALISFGLPMIGGWLFILFGNTVALIMIGRTITGLAVGLICGTAPLYVCEISTDGIRGLLGTCFQICITLGILLGFSLGICLNFNWLALVSLIPSLLMSLAMLLMSETPIWLLSHSKDSEAEKALQRLRHKTNDNESELNDMMEHVKSSINSSGFTLLQTKNPEFYKPFLLANGLMFFQQFSGINAVMYYSTSIFTDSGSSLEPSISTIIIGVALVISTVLSAILIDRWGRKLLLIISSSGHSISLGVMCLYYFLTKDITLEENSWGWIPLVCLVIFIISFSVGWGPIPWLMTVEMSPITGATIINSIAVALNWLWVFVITKNFNWLQLMITKQGTFLFFAVICLVSILFVIFLLPETKGKPLEEIVRNFSNNSSSRSSSTDLGAMKIASDEQVYGQVDLGYPSDTWPRRDKIDLEDLSK